MRSLVKLLNSFWAKEKEKKNPIYRLDRQTEIWKDSRDLTFLY